METVATLNRMPRERLASLLNHNIADPAPSIAIIDVRDSDHVGGHIKGSSWVPSGTLDHKVPELVRTLQDKDMVIFHCALSQQRGPSAALRYLRERERLLKPETKSEGDVSLDGAEQKQKEARSAQQVFVLDGGFVRWQEKYGPDETLTVGWASDIWQE